MSAPLSRGLSLLAVATAGLSLAGCGGSSSDPLKEATKAANTTMSQSLVSDYTVYGATVYGKVHATITGRGAFSFGPELGFQRIDIPAEAGNPKLREFLDFLPTTFVFTKTTTAGTVLVNGKLWVSTAVAGPGSVHPIVPGFIYQTQGMSPELSLDEIAWGATAATKVASPVVNHVPLTEYRVSVSLDRALAKATGAVKSAIGEEIVASGSHTATIMIWVDGPGHIVQLKRPLPGSGIKSIWLSLSNFGVKFTSSLPVASTELKITAQTPAGGDLLRSVWIFEIPT